MNFFEVNVFMQQELIFLISYLEYFGIPVGKNLSHTASVQLYNYPKYFQTYIFFFI